MTPQGIFLTVLVCIMLAPLVFFIVAMSWPERWSVWDPDRDRRTRAQVRNDKVTTRANRDSSAAGPTLHDQYAAGEVTAADDSADAWRQQQYGEVHQRIHALLAAPIKQVGAVCCERVCVPASRRILPGERWHLAHDHLAGGDKDYLGPAHPGCNEAEARGRGVEF